ncbi:MAG: hypothetical protein ACW99J_19035 [Candidatus Thorarchaeota archaeon]|jgi:hypothetical protein
MQYHFEIKRTVVETLDIFVDSNDVGRAETIASEYARVDAGVVLSREVTGEIEATLVDKLHVRNTTSD